MTQRSLSTESLPWLIQGGMGIAISSWRLARTVSLIGQLGVVSGTAIDNVFVRRLQDHGVDQMMSEILQSFPNQKVVDPLLRDFGARRKPLAPYRTLPMLTHESSGLSIDALVLAAFVEVSLAKRGHDGAVGINLLTKVQLPTAATLCGAMLAGVDYVIMGAGVPTHIPGVLERLSRGEPVELPLSISGASGENPATSLRFDPTPYLDTRPLVRPRFVAVVSSHVLATALAKRSNGPVDGFVVERPVAGGHNAPPRGSFEVDAEGNPVYGPRDVVDYDALSALGKPFWIGGGVTSPEHVKEAFSLGASGVQVGTLFAYCTESGMEIGLRRRIVNEVARGAVQVRTSLRASSTGYPFKVAAIPGTIAAPDAYAARKRRCDLGYLREPFAKTDGSLGYRCAAEPVTAYVRKGGLVESTTGAACLCNGLMATCGLGQLRSSGGRETPIVTSGDCINEMRALLGAGGEYSASDVVAHLSSALGPYRNKEER